MGQALDRPWLSQFDKEFYYWEDHKDEYRGMKPDHGNGSWKVDIKENGQRFNRNFKSLEAAKEAVTKFRQSAGRGVEHESVHN